MSERLDQYLAEQDTAHEQHQRDALCCPQCGLPADGCTHHYTAEYIQYLVEYGTVPTITDTWWDADRMQERVLVTPQVQYTGQRYDFSRMTPDESEMVCWCLRADCPECQAEGDKDE